MGKRKDRRLPAGRRVKLDLFAEPCEDASNQDEVNGAEDDSKSRAGLISSPSSSSDQQPENPLMLLGQYSDDELDEESSKNINDTIVENFLADIDDEKEDKTTEPVSANCEVQVDEDVSSGWKLVFHEESDRYYYWNLVTGETSWDVPCAQTDGATEVENNVVLGVELKNGHTIASLPSDETLNCEISQDLPAMEVPNEGHACDKSDSKSEGLDVDINISYSPSGQSYSPAKKESHECILVDEEDAEMGTNFSSSIVKQGEYLFEKLASLKSSEIHLLLKEQLSNHIMEVELRLNDIKSLSSHGSSLLPFWQHSQRQLNRIEAIYNELLQSSEIEKTNNGDDNIKENSEDDCNVKVSQVLEDDNSVGVHAEHLKTEQNEVLAELSSAVTLQAEEDMDVDMEVEDIPYPPPPVDDWIPPPPPPDSENIPLPPPEEPLESTFPPGADTFSYTHQYDQTCTVSGYEYYAQTSTVSSSGFYTLADGQQLAAPLPIYYNTYPVDTVSYYSLHDASGSSGSVGQSHVQVGSHSLPQVTIDDTSGGETTTSYSSAFVEAPATILVMPAAPTATAATALVTETVPKVQSKGRPKKKAVTVVSTLRSNKKVSSLVDKWKAAKDELQEEEDEPENALDMLEKKRRREIEEWHAQQIASGEAKDNANFQPLGGDWRERVKRRKAQVMKESSSLSEEGGDVGGDGKQPSPDAGQVSKGLPSGWKAYWDESSKLFYYANSLTSETTWIKPTS